MTIQPGDTLVVRGYSGNIIDHGVRFSHFYWTRGVQFAAYRRDDGMLCSVEANRVQPLAETALASFTEKLNYALDFLREIGANDCGDLTIKQAARFHRAVANLVKLSEELEP